MCRKSRWSWRAGLAVAVAAILLAPVSAHASGRGCGTCTVRYVSISAAGHRGPGPLVLEVGRASASRVVVLVPGWFAAAGSLRPLALELAGRLTDTQIWIVDRREQRVEDLSHVHSGLSAEARYYLGGRYRRPGRSALTSEAGWGLRVAMDDLRLVVRAARAHGRRRVVLGGHSWGATLALCYAAWDFHGHAGFRDLQGLVLIDGGVHGAFAGEGDVYNVTPEEARSELAQIRRDPVDDSLALLYEVKGSATAPILVQLAAQAALAAPRAPSVLATALPAAWRPSMAVTNRGLLGWMFDTHAPIPDLSVHSGHLARAGRLYDWVDAGRTPISRLAQSLAGPEPTPFEWYWPARLTLDLEAADPFAETPTARLLGLKLFHAAQITTPLYVFATGLEHGTVTSSARWLVAHTKIRVAEYDGDNAMTHLEPTLDSPPHNRFMTTLVRFLARLNRRG